MESKIIKISLPQLADYCNYINNSANQLISLNEYIKTSLNQKEEVIADLSGIEFPWQATERFSLRGADLSNTILDNINFNNQKVVLEGANLKEASLQNTKFTGHISLAGVDFGEIELSKEVFIDAILNDAIYQPIHNNKVVTIAVNDRQLTNYLRLVQSNDIPAAAQGNLNLYLKSILKHNYPEETIFVADLSNKDLSNFNIDNADFSNAIIHNTIFAGKITNISLRDADIFNAHFKELEIIKIKSDDGKVIEAKLVDNELISTELTNIKLVNGQFINTKSIEGEIANLEVIERQTIAAELINSDLRGSDLISYQIENQLILSSPKLSISSNVLTAKESLQQVVDLILNPRMSIQDKAIFDPCYERGLTKELAQSITEYLQLKRQDLIDYRNFLEADQDQPISLYDYLVKVKKINSDQQILFSFASEDLSNLDLADLDLQKIDFSLCDFSRTILDRANLSGANLAGANLAGNGVSKTKDIATNEPSGWLIGTFNSIVGVVSNTIDSLRSERYNTSLKNTILTASNLTNTQAKYADFSGAKLNDVFAPNLRARNANFFEANLQSAYLQEADMDDAILKNIQAQNIHLQASSAYEADFSSGNLQGANFSYSTLIDANFTGSDLKSSNFEGCILKNAKLNNANLTKSRLKADIDKVEFNNTILSEADLGGALWFNPPIIEETQFEKTIHSKESAILNQIKIEQKIDNAVTGNSWYRKVINFLIDSLPSPLNKPIKTIANNIFKSIDSFSANKKLIIGLTITGGLVAGIGLIVASPLLLPAAAALTLSYMAIVPVVAAGAAVGFISSLAISSNHKEKFNQELLVAKAAVDEINNDQQLANKRALETKESNYAGEKLVTSYLANQQKENNNQSTKQTSFVENLQKERNSIKEITI